MNELLQVEVGKDQKCTLSEWRDKLLKWICESKSWNLFKTKLSSHIKRGLENQRNNMGGAEDREEDRQYHGWLAGQVGNE